jgi:hypothetical protein
MPCCGFTFENDKIIIFDVSQDAVQKFWLRLFYLIDCSYSFNKNKF